MEGTQAGRYRELAAAMRRGMQFGGQARGIFVAVHEFGAGVRELRTCAVGAVLLGTEGISGDIMESVAMMLAPPGLVIPPALANSIGKVIQRLLDKHPVLMERCGCPQPDGCVTRPQDWEVINIIEHLNDVHRWSREQILAWLETRGQEKGQEEPPPAKTRVRRQRRGVVRQPRELVEA